MQRVAIVYQLTVIFERVVGRSLLPANTSRHYTKRLVADLVLLVEHQEVGRSFLSLERLFTMLDGPLELLGSNQDLAKDGIDAGLATVEARCSNNCVLVVEEEPDSSVW